MIERYLSDTQISKAKIESDKKIINELTDKVTLSESLYFKENIIIDSSIWNILLIKFIHFYETNIQIFHGLFVVIIAMLISYILLL